MKVYVLRADSDHYESLLMAGGDLYEFASRFNGKPMKKLGKDARIKKDPRRLPKGDFPSLIPGVPVFSRIAVEALRDLLEANGEIFPAKIDGERYFLFNVTALLTFLMRPILHSQDLRMVGSFTLIAILFWWRSFRGYLFLRFHKWLVATST